MASAHSTRNKTMPGRRRRKNACMAEINVTPFVDITLVLLIVFMISAPLLVNGVSIDLPKTQASALPTDTKAITISIDSNDKLYIDHELVADRQQLVTDLKLQVQNPGQQQIFVHGARNASYEKILQMLALLQQAGFKRLALASLPQQ